MHLLHLAELFLIIDVQQYGVIGYFLYLLYASIPRRLLGYRSNIKKVLASSILSSRWRSMTETSTFSRSNTVTETVTYKVIINREKLCGLAIGRGR